jgi:hypothetical protein
MSVRKVSLRSLAAYGEAGLSAAMVDGGEDEPFTKVCILKNKVKVSRGALDEVKILPTRVFETR